MLLAVKTLVCASVPPSSPLPQVHSPLLTTELRFLSLNCHQNDSASAATSQLLKYLRVGVAKLPSARSSEGEKCGLC